VVVRLGAVGGGVARVEAQALSAVSHNSSGSVVDNAIHIMKHTSLTAAEPPLLLLNFSPFAPPQCPTVNGALRSACLNVLQPLPSINLSFPKGEVHKLRA
jgi:hypothetical protein